MKYLTDLFRSTSMFSETNNMEFQEVSSDFNHAILHVGPVAFDFLLSIRLREDLYTLGLRPWENFTIIITPSFC